MSRILLCAALAALTVANPYDPVTDNVFLFNAGTCYSSDCSCRTDCCDPSSLLDKFQEAYDPVPVSTTPGAQSSGLVDDQQIGYGADFNLQGANLCDHANDTTAVFQDPFLYDGFLKYCRWYMNADCTDDGLAFRPGAFGNHMLRFGIFEKDPSQTHSYKLLSYVELDRASWYDAIMKNTTGAFFTYSFTKGDLATLKIDNQKIKDLHIGFSWSSGGAVAYQSFNNNWLGQTTMAIYDDPNNEFPTWDQLGQLPTNYVVATMGTKQPPRRYNMHCVYGPKP